MLNGCQLLIKVFSCMPRTGKGAEYLKEESAKKGKAYLNEIQDTNTVSHSEIF